MERSGLVSSNARRRLQRRWYNNVLSRQLSLASRLLFSHLEARRCGPGCSGPIIGVYRVAAGSEVRGSAGDITLVHVAQAGGTQGLGLDSGPAPPELQSNPARAMARAMPSTATTPMPSTELLWLPEGPSSKAGSFEPAGSLAEEPEPRTKAGQARSGIILLGLYLGHESHQAASSWATSREESRHT